MFEKNMGLADRIIRPTLAFGIIAAVASGKLNGITGYALLGLAGVFLITSAFGSCPVYQALRIDTLNKEEQEEVNF